MHLAVHYARLWVDKMGKNLRRIRPGIGGSGQFHGPIGGHISYPVPGIGEYFLQNTDTPKWQEELYPIYTREIIPFPPLPGNKDLSQEQIGSPIPDQYLRVRTRMRGYEGGE